MSDSDDKKRWRDKNKEYVSAYAKARYDEKKDDEEFRAKRRAAHKKWYDANRERAVKMAVEVKKKKRATRTDVRQWVRRQKPIPLEDKLMADFFAKGGKIKRYETVSICKELTDKERKMLVGASARDTKEIVYLDDAPRTIDTYELKMELIG